MLLNTFYVESKTFKYIVQWIVTIAFGSVLWFPLPLKWGNWVLWRLGKIIKTQALNPCQQGVSSQSLEPLPQVAFTVDKELFC